MPELDDMVASTWCHWLSLYDRPAGDETMWIFLLGKTPKITRPFLSRYIWRSFRGSLCDVVLPNPMILPLLVPLWLVLNQASMEKLFGLFCGLLRATRQCRLNIADFRGVSLVHPVLSDSAGIPVNIPLYAPPRLLPEMSTSYRRFVPL